jgi:hypothetical protein
MPVGSATIDRWGLAKSKVAAIRARAKRLGVTPERYARQLIEHSLSVGIAARTTTFDELLAPVREDFRKSGMTLAELDELVDAARTRHHNRVKKGSA